MIFTALNVDVKEFLVSGEKVISMKKDISKSCSAFIAVKK